MFTVILTVMALSAPVVQGQEVTLKPDARIEFHNTTEKNTTSACVRVQKALAASMITSFCSPAVDATQTVATTAK